MHFPKDVFTEHDLGNGLKVLECDVPSHLVWSDDTLNQVWTMQPEERHRVKMFTRWITVPRGQQAYGADYEYTGSKNNALPVPLLVKPLLDWVQETVDERINGMLLNFYGPEDYIGPHHDSTKGLVDSSSIVMVSYGEERTFRLSHGKGQAKRNVDFDAKHGKVFVLPWNTNKAWKHAVPKRARYCGHRISVTFRAFTDGVLAPNKYWANTPLGLPN